MNKMRYLSLVILVAASTEVNYGATAVTEGREIYMSLCQACHGADGKGNDGMAANFVDDKSILAKSDIELLDVIANGKGTMPAWGAILQPWQQISVLQHIRQTYGDALSVADDLSDVARDARALELYLQDKQDHKQYCPNIAWEQPSLETYKQQLKSHLPEGCKNE
jgi:mono/diheme cytochrome c family protein